MPTININGRECEFETGQTILQVALDHEIEIPHYCYHPGMSIVASCRICLAEVWAPNPRNDNKLEPIPKLLPACQTTAAEGQFVYTDSPKSIANQRAVMEYLLINHPVDCPVCDQAGECYLQDYAYQYGRSKARFTEAKIKQPKKDIGPHVLLYADRCIMCSRCVRFTREVTGTGELMVAQRGAHSEIDVFPGVALDNELSANVIDLCPVGALLDKDFLFQQRVWFLKKTPSIDPLTCSGDNIWIEHNEGTVYRIKPRTNMDVNTWWITDEVRYGWKFVHDETRITVPVVKGEEPFAQEEAAQAYESAYSRIIEELGERTSIGALISPNLSCEDAFHLAKFILEIDSDATLGIGPIPHEGNDREFPGGFKVFAEKAPNSRGVRRVLRKLTDNVLGYQEFVTAINSAVGFKSLIVTGNYPSQWVTDALVEAVGSDSGSGSRFVVLMDTLSNSLVERADVVLPAATWAEKAGTFENVNNHLQSFERAISPIDYTKSEAQIAIDLLAEYQGEAPASYNAESTRQTMSNQYGLTEFTSDIHSPEGGVKLSLDVEMVEL